MAEVSGFDETFLERFSESCFLVVWIYCFSL